MWHAQNIHAFLRVLLYEWDSCTIIFLQFSHIVLLYERDSCIVIFLQFNSYLTCNNMLEPQVSPDGKQFSVTSPDRMIRVFWFRTGKKRRVYDESLQVIVYIILSHCLNVYITLDIHVITVPLALLGGPRSPEKRFALVPSRSYWFWTKNGCGKGIWKNRKCTATKRVVWRKLKLPYICNSPWD